MLLCQILVFKSRIKTAGGKFGFRTESGSRTRRKRTGGKVGGGPLHIPGLFLQITAVDLDTEQLASILEGSGPILTLGLFGLFLLLFLPVSYHLRLSGYFLMDAPEKGAIYALISSFQYMRGNCLSMVRLDLSFLWFYVLEILVGLLCYGDIIAEALHIPLPLSPDGAYLLFLGAYLLCQFGLYVWQKNYVSVTYACAYRTLAEQPEEP